MKIEAVKSADADTVKVEQAAGLEQETGDFLPTSPMAARLHVTPFTLIK